MDIPSDLDDILTPKLATLEKELPPSPVYFVLASLFNPSDALASVRAFSWSFDPLTTWSARFVTAKALVVAEIEFEAERYTRAEELKYRDSNVTWTVREARARPLREVTEYSVGGGITGLQASITFRGEAPMVLPGLAAISQQEKQRADDFVRAVQDGIDWLA